ncbi:hypothetical protein [Flavobacteriaceae bacterium 14752]|uniref:hypothetical protein n=1 Tax=Mesohalobacter salilacus TaxID=2491711 RepID=UPI000F630AE9|nr:hypothetical protein EIG84_11485 [Flavobacteriaceae bacterium 14752]
MKSVYRYLVVLIVLISCKSSTLILDYSSEYECDGVYYSKDKQKPAHFYMSGTLPLDVNAFRIEYEFKTTEYRDQWPIILSKLNRVIGVKLARNGNSYLTINNQRESFNLDFEYQLNQWYKVMITHLEGKVSVRVDDKLLFKDELKLNTDFPKKDYVITSCNFSNGDCFVGTLKNIKVENIKAEKDTEDGIKEKIVTEKKSKETKPSQKKDECSKIWQSSFPKDSLKVSYIVDVMSKNQLSHNNLKFLNALKNKKAHELAFNNALSPVFRRSNTEIGVFAFPKYKMVDNAFVRDSKEFKLINKVDSIDNMSVNFNPKLEFYPEILDSIFRNKPKPQINYYTTKRHGSTKIEDLGAYLGECLEYYEYAFDTTQISNNDKVLFSSPYKIDLVYENNEKIDAILKNNPLNECHDCPHSKAYQKTFAKIQGTDNLYFVYADTFPINNQLDTPLRALIFVNQDNEIIYLWYEELDLFGCSCL